MFTKASDNSKQEFVERKLARLNMLQFGIPFLDDACMGIQQSDLILLGAPSGLGKTEICCSIALANLMAGKRVHYIALEAEKYEIERRLKYKIFASAYFGDPDRPKIECRMSYDLFRIGHYEAALAQYEDITNKLFEEGYENLFIYNKGEKFGIEELIETITINGQSSDLIIIDHVHYFDFDDDNENRAIKNIAKATRTLALEEGKPIILVSHLRKRDRFNKELAAGLDEFHGSSDLYKIATKVVTMAPGSPTENGNFETFFRIPKNRSNGSATRYLGRVCFNPRTNAYEPAYKIGASHCDRDSGFEELNHSLYPDWAKRPEALASDCYPNAQRQTSPSQYQRGPYPTKASWADGNDEWV